MYTCNKIYEGIAVLYFFAFKFHLKKNHSVLLVVNMFGKSHALSKSRFPLERIGVV